MQNNLTLGTLYNQHSTSSQEYVDSSHQESNGFHSMPLVYPDATSMPSPPPTPLGMGMKNISFPMMPMFPNPAMNDPSKLRQLMESSSDSFRQNVWFPPFNMFPSFMMPDSNPPLAQTTSAASSNIQQDMPTYFPMPTFNMLSAQPNSTMPLISPPILQKSRSENRLYHCTRSNCSKVYKNANGLKYHLDKGSCEWDYESTNASPVVTSPQSSSTTVKLVHRPYACKVQGCGKKYKVYFIYYICFIKYDCIEFEWIKVSRKEHTSYS